MSTITQTKQKEKRKENEDDNDEIKNKECNVCFFFQNKIMFMIFHQPIDRTKSIQRKPRLSIQWQRKAKIFSLVQ